MLDGILSIIAPHYCCWCGKIGSLLCGDCKYDIITEPFEHCLLCYSVVTPSNNLCDRCHPPYTLAWCVGERSESLQRLIGLYKFQRTYAGYKELASLLDERLPYLPSHVVLVPVPTVSSHVRERGYDHMLMIAKRLAKLRHLSVETVLVRSNSAMQRHASRSLRRKQAKEAFTCPSQLSDKKTYLIIDDVMTTGATLHYAAERLIAAGAKEVWVATIARQPLD